MDRRGGWREGIGGEGGGRGQEGRVEGGDRRGGWREGTRRGGWREGIGGEGGGRG